MAEVSFYASSPSRETILHNLEKRKLRTLFIIAFGPVLAVDEGVIDIIHYIKYRDNLSAGYDDLPEVCYKVCHKIWRDADKRFKIKNRVVLNKGAFKSVHDGMYELGSLDKLSENIDAYFEDMEDIDDVGDINIGDSSTDTVSETYETRPKTSSGYVCLIQQCSPKREEEEEEKEEDKQEQEEGN